MGKKQHYVPKMILKHFSNNNDKKNIGVYLIKSMRIIPSSPLRNQAYGNNLYGADQILEKIYGKIEGMASPIIDKIINEDIVINLNEEYILRNFIAFQYTRTKFARKTANEALNNMTRNIIKEDKKLNKHIDSIKIEYTEPFKFMFDVTIDLPSIISDLKFALLANKNDIPIIIGEHPITILNPFLIERKWIGSKNGLAVKGAIIYMPLSSEKALILYDKNRYRTKKHEKNVVLSVKDVHKLNQCQMALTEDCVFFNSNCRSIPFDEYNLNTQEYRENEKTSFNVYEEKISEKRKKKKGYRELVVSRSKEIPITQNFDFIHLLEKSLYEDLGTTMDISRDEIRQYLYQREART